MVVEVIKLSSVTLQWRQKQPINYGKAFYICMAVHIKHSFAQTEKKSIFPENENLREQKPLTVFFQNVPSLSLERDDDTVKIQIKGYGGDVETILGVANLNLKDFLANQFIEMDEGNSIGSSFGVKYKIDKKQLNEKGFLILKNIQCESLLLSNTHEKYQLEIKCGNRCYRSCRELFHLFWQNQFKMFIESQQQYLVFSILDGNGKYSKLIEVSLKIFKTEKGSKKIFITNQNNFPVGCLQFDYEAQSFFQQKKQDSQCLQPRQMFKIYIGNVIAKLKDTYDSLYTRIMSGVSSLQVFLQSQKSNKFQIIVNNYIYSEKQGCTFMVMCKDNGTDVLGFATLNLTMLGKFQQRFKILNSENKKEMGTIFAEVQALKLPIRTLRISHLSLKINRIDGNKLDSKVYIDAKLGGLFGKTELKKIEDKVDYSKSLQISFTKQQVFILNIVDQLKNQISIQISLIELQKCKNSFFQKIFGSSQTFISGTLKFQFNFPPRNFHDKNDLLQQRNNQQSSIKHSQQIQNSSKKKEEKNKSQTKMQMEKRSTEQQEVNEQESLLMKAEKQQKGLLKEAKQKMYLGIIKKKARQVILNHQIVVPMNKNIIDNHHFTFNFEPKPLILNQSKNTKTKHIKINMGQVKNNTKQLKILPKQNNQGRDSYLFEVYMGRQKNFRIYSKQKIVKPQRSCNNSSNKKRESVDSSLGIYQAKGFKI